MFCSKCGNQIADGSLFCEYCGAKQMQPVQQPQTGQLNQPVQQPQTGQLNQPIQQNKSAQPIQPAYAGQPVQPGGDEGGKNNKPLIIAGIVIGALVLIGLIVLIVVLLTRKPEEKEVVEEVTTEEVTTEEPTTVAEATPEEPEPEPVPYAEEMGCHLVDQGYKIEANSSTVLVDENLEIIHPEEIDIKGSPYSFEFGRVAVSEPDENGMVKYYVECTAAGEFSALVTSNEYRWYYENVFYSPLVVDYYTGYVLNVPADKYGLLDEDVEHAETKFDKFGEEINVKIVTQYKTNVDETKDSSEEVDGGTLYSSSFNDKEIFVFEVPENYDGIMLGELNSDVSSKFAEDLIMAKYSTETDAEEEKPKESTELRKVFEANEDGEIFGPEERDFYKISDYAVPLTDEIASEFFSTNANSYEEYFDWATDNPQGTDFGGKIVTSTARLNGGWRCFLLWDRNNEMDCYGKETISATTSFDGNNLSLTFDYDEVLWGEDGEWESKDDENSTFSGTMAEDGSVTFDEEGMNFTLKGFYDDGYGQYAIGSMTVQSGETAEVFLVRP